MEIGERIHHYRKLCGMTQEDVAKKLRTTPQNIYKYEKGIIKNIPLQSIVTMSELFGISPAELAGISDPSTTQKTDSFDASPSHEKQIFGLRLRTKREEKGMSIRELALKLHILPSIIENYENGLFEAVDDSRINKISEILDVSPEYFHSKTLPENCGVLVLNDTERLLVLKYRAKPQYHAAVHQLLGISPHDTQNTDSFSYPVLSSSDIENYEIRGRIAQPMNGVYRTDKKED